MGYRDGVYFHNFLAGMRIGKRVKMEQLCGGICSVSTLARIEAGERLPGKLVRDRLLERLGIANSGFEDFLPVEEYERWRNRQELLQAIADRNEEKAAGLIQCYEQESMWSYTQADREEDTGGAALERQFYLTMKAQLMQYRGLSQEKLCAAFKEALELTVLPGTARRRHIFLSAKEWNLLLEYVRFGGNVESLQKDNQKAEKKAGMSEEVTCAGHSYKIQVYGQFLAAIEDSSMDLAAFVGIYPKVAYYLCRECMQEPEGQWNCMEMLGICARAVDMLRSTERLYYLCELLEGMERILVVYIGCQEQGPDTEDGVTWQTAWNQLSKENRSAAVKAVEITQDTMPLRRTELASLLVQIRQWRWVLAEVYREYGMPQQMDNCCYLYWQFQNYCVGDVVRRRRKMLGLSVKELCEGICSEKTLRRLENNKTKTQMPIVMELFERMGLPTEYQRKEIVMERYLDFAIYNAMAKALNNNDTEGVDKSLDRLKSSLDLNLLINRQELQHIEILNELRKKNISPEEAVSCIRKTLELTFPWQAAQHAAEGYMTCGELGCLYNIAMKTRGEEKEEYVELLKKICDQYMLKNDIKNHIDMYEFIMDGVASHLGNMGQYEESSRISASIIKEKLSLGRMGMLHMSLYNILWNETQYKKDTKNIPVEQSLSREEELQKCILLAELCKDVFYENIYREKMNQILH